MISSKLERNRDCTLLSKYVDIRNEIFYASSVGGGKEKIGEEERQVEKESASPNK